MQTILLFYLKPFNILLTTFLCIAKHKTPWKWLKEQNCHIFERTRSQNIHLFYNEVIEIVKELNYLAKNTFVTKHKQPCTII